MNEPLLTVRVESAPERGLRVRAPLIGVWSDHPHPGNLLGPGSRVGRLSHLNRTFVLAMPEGAAGRVAAGLPRDRAIAVEYDQVLFDLSPLGVEDEAELERAGEVGGYHPLGGLGADAHAVVAPTDGVFYRSPSPGAPPFVDVGSRVRSGTPVGLIEVMKTFSQIGYGGPGLPEEAAVVEIRCADGAEVRAGQVLLVVR